MFLIIILYYLEYVLKNKHYIDILIHFPFLKCKQSSIVMSDQKRAVWSSGRNKLVKFLNVFQPEIMSVCLRENTVVSILFTSSLYLFYLLAIFFR